MSKKSLRWPVGIIDIGSQSIRMVVFDNPKARKPSFNSKISCALGQGMDSTGKLSAPGKSKSLHTLKGFYELSQALGVGTLLPFATAAVRDAKDGRPFVKKMETALRRKISVISGQQEGRLAAQGVVSSIDSLTGVVCDLGGGSLELALVIEGRFIKAMTLPLGSLRMLSNKARLAAYIEKHLATVPEDYQAQGPLYFIGGSFRSLADLHGRLRGRNEKNLHGYTIRASDLTELRRRLARLSPERLVEIHGASPDRAPALSCVALLAQSLARHLDADKMIISTVGVREGVMIDLKKHGKIK